MGRVVCELLSTQNVSPRYKDKDGRNVVTPLSVFQNRLDDTRSIRGQYSFLDQYSKISRRIFLHDVEDSFCNTLKNNKMWLRQ
jgi:hypothetical protein